MHFISKAKEILEESSRSESKKDHEEPTNKKKVKVSWFLCICYDVKSYAAG